MINIGDTIKIGNHQYLVVHYEKYVGYFCILKYFHGCVTFGATPDFMTSYLRNLCQTWFVTEVPPIIMEYCYGTTCNSSLSMCFIPPKRLVHGGFEYFDSAEHRKFYDECGSMTFSWWTATADNEAGKVWTVAQDGQLVLCNSEFDLSGFRPCLCINKEAFDEGLLGHDY